MRTPVTGEVHVAYGQIYVLSDPDRANPDLAEAFAGQRAGLCGAAVPGALWLVTGLHTGRVGFTVEVHDTAPPPDPEWEDVVEVSFRPVSEHTSLVEWAGQDAGDLGLARADYRVRYCARGMDEGREPDTRTAGKLPADSYLLQFWPAPPGPARVVRQTSRCAAYWHRYARKLPPPPGPRERAEAERLAREAEERAARERRQHFERWEWGGRLPSERLREVGGNVLGLLRFDSDLVHALDAAGPEVQRAVAVLAARRACEVAGLTGVPWVARGLAAVAEGRPLPPPFDDGERMFATLSSDPRVPDRSVLEAIPPERPPYRPPAPPAGVRYETSPVVVTAHSRPRGPRSRPDAKIQAAPARGERYEAMLVVETPGVPRRPGLISQPHYALPAVPAAADPSPLRAALDAVWAAVGTYGEHYPRLLAEIRSAVTGPAPGRTEVSERPPAG